VTPNEVQSLAQRYIDPNRMTIVVVGDKASVEQQLQPFQQVVP
jgi:predicted Zn-dependent peptidase